MSATSPRVADAGQWQQRGPIGITLALMCGLVLVSGAMVAQYAYVLTPLQRFYLKPYVWSSITASQTRSTVRFKTLSVVGTTRRLARNDDVIDVRTADGWRLGVSPQASANGFTGLAKSDEESLNARLRDDLRRSVFGMTAITLALPTAVIAVLTFMICFVVGGSYDARRRRIRSGEGKLLQGTPRLDLESFNRRSSGLWWFGRMRYRWTGRHPRVLELRVR